jgi:hypothetical protein
MSSATQHSQQGPAAPAAASGALLGDPARGTPIVSHNSSGAGLPNALVPESPGHELPSQPAPVKSSVRATVEIGGRDGPEPTRFGDWEKRGRCIDF